MKGRQLMGELLLGGQRGREAENKKVASCLGQREQSCLKRRQSWKKKCWLAIEGGRIFSFGGRLLKRSVGGDGWRRVFTEGNGRGGWWLVINQTTFAQRRSFRYNFLTP